MTIVASGSGALDVGGKFRPVVSWCGQPWRWVGVFVYDTHAEADEAARDALFRMIETDGGRVFQEYAMTVERGPDGTFPTPRIDPGSN